MRINAGDEPWMDLIGNLEEITLRNTDDPAVRFRYKGYGHQYGSITHHRNQWTTPRGKSGSIGARCMRFD